MRAGRPAGPEATEGSAVHADARSPGPARWVVCVLLLAGLFFMHGAPGSATGCHGMTTASIPMSHTAMAARGDRLPSVSAASAQAVPAQGMDGMLCVSAPPLRGLDLPGALLLAVLALGASPLLRTLRAAAGGPVRRGPPPGWRLLTRICVART